jgi:hypothetical protein
MRGFYASLAKGQLKKIAPEEPQREAKDEVVEQTWCFRHRSKRPGLAHSSLPKFLTTGYRASAGRAMMMVVAVCGGKGLR